MTHSICPICDQQTEDININEDNIRFLNSLKDKGILNEYLSVSRSNIDILNSNAPTSAIIARGVNTIRKTTSSEFAKLENELSKIIKRKIEETIPNPEKFENLSQVIPEILLKIQELLKKEQVPNLKGREGEIELFEELSNYFPKDHIEHLGKTGETDIVLTPLINGVSTQCDVLVESKKNSRWRRSYLEQLRRHMNDRNSRYGILAVETMPSGENMYLSETYPDGTIFVTQRKQCKLAYGAIRAVIISDYSLGRRRINLQYALKNAKIQEAITNAFTTTSTLESIRKHVNTIISKAKKVEDDANEAEYILQTCLTELQARIQDEVTSTDYLDHTSTEIAKEIGG
ncbi:MAG: DUF2130 domain-containing protein [Candidatus Heimdallarchaeaceae archaeon]